MAGSLLEILAIAAGFVVVKFDAEPRRLAHPQLAVLDLQRLGRAGRRSCRESWDSSPGAPGGFGELGTEGSLSRIQLQLSGSLARTSPLFPDGPTPLARVACQRPLLSRTHSVGSGRTTVPRSARAEGAQRRIVPSRPSR